MSTEEILPIHPDFARWYATVELGDDELRRESRCAGISALVQEANSTDIEALVRLAFKSRQPPVTEQVQKIRQSFKTADATFEMQGNDRELQILAAASLATMMHGDFRHGGEAALAATTAYLDSARKPDLPMDLLL
ncbi:MAG TPA: hypothetical protein VET88_06985, partial [Gammaproteobacteria bacterium]|nr:hypothetical protein [Gammaproteobacteria bacterium]